MKIRYYSTIPEFEAIEAFLKWQQQTFTAVEDISVLRDLRGKGGVVIEVDGLVLKGFKELWAHWNDEGKFLC